MDAKHFEAMLLEMHEAILRGCDAGVADLRNQPVTTSRLIACYRSDTCDIIEQLGAIIGDLSCHEYLRNYAEMVTVICNSLIAGEPVVLEEDKQPSALTAPSFAGQAPAQLP